MSYKAKKMNNVNKKAKEPKDPNKFHLGRNLGTYLIMILGLVGIVFIVLVLFSTLIGSTSYLQVYNNNKVTPYQDESHQSLYINSETEEVIYEPHFVEAKDFNLFDIKLQAESFDSHDQHQAKFNFYISQNDESPKLVPIRYNSSTGFTTVTSSTYRAYVSICVASDWVGVCDYSSSYTYITQSNIEKKIDATEAKTITVSLKTDEVFPMKTKNWPVPVTISRPDAYVFLAFYSEVKGNSELNYYIIHYTYDEFYVTGLTSPAI